MKSFLLSLLFGSFMCGCVSATVTEPRACDSTVIIFPGAPINPGFQLPPVTKSFTLGVGFSRDFVTKVFVTDGQLTRNDGGDFSFLDDLTVSVTDPNGGHDLVLWDNKNNNTTMLPIAAPTVNLVNYIDNNNNLAMNVTVSTQQPPSSDWSIAVDLCVSAELDKTLP